MKIIKHAHEETTDAAQGGLLGLVKDGTLEVTNCFPFPNLHKPENTDLGKFPFVDIAFSMEISLDLEQYQTDIIRNLRRVNSDYLQVGFYDSSFNRSLAQSMVSYQLSGVEESIALVYGKFSKKKKQSIVHVFRFRRSSIGCPRLHRFESISFNTSCSG